MPSRPALGYREAVPTLELAVRERTVDAGDSPWPGRYRSLTLFGPPRDPVAFYRLEVQLGAGGREAAVFFSRHLRRGARAWLERHELLTSGRAAGFYDPRTDVLRLPYGAVDARLRDALRTLVRLAGEYTAPGDYLVPVP